MGSGSPTTACPWTRCTANGEIELHPGRRGEPRVLTGELDAHAREFRWLPDSQGLCCLVSERGRVDLRRVPSDGGRVETLVTADREMLAYDLSPDGAAGGLCGQHATALPAISTSPHLEGSGEQRLTEVNAGWLAGQDTGRGRRPLVRQRRRHADPGLDCQAPGL